jgi:hypothetical protein
VSKLLAMLGRVDAEVSRPVILAVRATPGS